MTRVCTAQAPPLLPVAPDHKDQCLPSGRPSDKGPGLSAAQKGPGRSSWLLPGPASAAVGIWGNWQTKLQGMPLSRCLSSCFFKDFTRFERQGSRRRERDPPAGWLKPGALSGSLLGLRGPKHTGCPLLSQVHSRELGQRSATEQPGGEPVPIQDSSAPVAA